MALSTLEVFIIAILLILPFLWKSSRTLRFYTKIVFYNAWVLTMTSFVLPIGCLRPGKVNNIRFIQWMLNSTSSMFGITVEVRGLHNLDSDQPRVFACNHQSSVDILSVMKFMPINTTAMMKKQLLYAGPFGLTCWLCGVIFVDRAGRGQGHKVTEGAAKIMREKNVNVWIFPEGTRYFNNDLLPFKKGAFYLAIQAQVPICPIVMSSYKNFLDYEKKIFTGGKVIATCLPQISTEGLTVNDVEELTERCRNLMRDTYMKTSEEVMQASKLNGASDRTKQNGGVSSADTDKHSGVATKYSGDVSTGHAENKISSAVKRENQATNETGGAIKQNGLVAHEHAS